MIPANARLRIERIPLEHLQVKEHQKRYPDRVLHYVKLLLDHPGEDAGLIHVTPSAYSGMMVILDGHHKYVAAIIAGREDALCVVVEEGPVHA